MKKIKSVLYLVCLLTNVLYAERFAEIKDEKVIRVIVADSKEWCESRLGGTWIETFKSEPTKNFAGIGYTYTLEKSNFIAPKPSADCVLNEKDEWVSTVIKSTEVVQSTGTTEGK